MQHASVRKNQAYGGGLWNPTKLHNPKKDSVQFTFQHIAWARLPHLIDSAVEDMDPNKRAAVKAGVLDVCKGNSKTGHKALPSAHKKRKSGGGPDAPMKLNTLRLSLTSRDVTAKPYYHR
ncbi:hypothetical protein DOTSEDRAFT_70196 [Dothistroma septosporum NZE10]|uniref:Uncharacterized protein n=1 Tax=Dothistroma septosporum (strain NZE10 / CBS 128990) TaxID=675120 RepID=N1PRW8_DOTSN|nr:hypothetical protein DOTSEDRAFT_70196 [Dothistroma septosporum NZE10]